MPVGIELVLPVVGATLVSVLLRRRTEGLWQVLEVLARGRAAAVLERERRATTTQLLRNLPEGGRWDEVDEAGRRRRIDLGARPSEPPAVPPVRDREPTFGVDGDAGTASSGEAR